MMRTKICTKCGKEFPDTIEEYDILLESQSGVCAICGKEETAKDKHGNPKRLSVDHDHETGKIRGLLCHRCNVGVGMLGTVELLNRAKDYIKENENGED